jgi:peptide-methionine (S)-S-oxide reductase
MNLPFLLHVRCAVLFLAIIGSAAAVAQETAAPAAPNGHEIATFAGGCFWCVESDFDNVPGVVRTVSGYTGGALVNPKYNQVSAGGTGHREAVQIYYDPKKANYATLLEIFWRSVDPTDDGGQFCDRGESYETAIFAGSPEQKRLAEASKHALEKSAVLDQPIVTPIEMAGPFYPAEDYHQDYYKKNPLRYKLYRFSCGRDSRIKELWGEDAHRGIATH